MQAASRLHTASSSVRKDEKRSWRDDECAVNESLRRDMYVLQPDIQHSLTRSLSFRVVFRLSNSTPLSELPRFTPCITATPCSLPVCFLIYHISRSLLRRRGLEELPALASLNAVLKHSIILIRIKCTRTSHRAGHRTVQRIEAVASDLSPEPKRGDAERAGAEGPEETAKGGGDEGTCTC